MRRSFILWIRSQALDEQTVRAEMTRTSAAQMTDNPEFTMKYGKFGKI